MAVPVLIQSVGRFHFVMMYLQGPVQGERRQGRHRKRWEDFIWS